MQSQVDIGLSQSKYPPPRHAKHVLRAGDVAHPWTLNRKGQQVKKNLRQACLVYVATLPLTLEDYSSGLDLELLSSCFLASLFWKMPRL